jgi:hypothetical protein
MPQMDPARWRAASLRLDEALELTGDQRAQWMAALREQDPLLADDVHGLLEEYDVLRQERFLEGQCMVSSWCQLPRSIGLINQSRRWTSGKAPAYGTVESLCL